jgi:hypothetical protein
MSNVVLQVRRLLPAVVYFSAPLPSAAVFTVFAVYGVISIIWGFQGRRALDVDSIFVPSPGWPPFVMPLALWTAFALIALLAIAELISGGRDSVVCTRSGVMSYLFGAGAFSSVLYSIGFLSGISWSSPATWAAAALALASVTAAVVSAVRVTAWARQRIHRSRRGER